MTTVMETPEYSPDVADPSKSVLVGFALFALAFTVALFVSLGSVV